MPDNDIGNLIYILPNQGFFFKKENPNYLTIMRCTLFLHIYLDFSLMLFSQRAKFKSLCPALIKNMLFSFY